MNRRIVAFAILVVVVISIAAFGLTFMKPQKKEVVGVSICDDIKTYDLKNICLAIFAGDPWKCKDAENFDTYCYDSVFSSMKNISEQMCQSFSDYYPRTTCYFNLAKLEKNPSLCIDSQGMFQKCSKQLAIITKNTTLCDKAESETEKYECLAEITGDDSFCKKISLDVERVVCFITLGKNADTKRCGEDVPIQNPSYSYTQRCVANVAVATKDISLCNQIDDLETKWTCFGQLSKTIDICEKGDNQFWVDLCKIVFIKTSLS